MPCDLLHFSNVQNLKFKGGFLPPAGQMKIMKAPPSYWVIKLTDTLASESEITLDAANLTPAKLNTAGEYTVEILSAGPTPLKLKMWGAGGGGGGEGAYVYGEISPEAGDVYKVWVGGGGTENGRFHHIICDRNGRYI